MIKRRRADDAAEPSASVELVGDEHVGYSACGGGVITFWISASVALFAFPVLVPVAFLLKLLWVQKRATALSAATAGCRVFAFCSAVCFGGGVSCALLSAIG